MAADSLLGGVYDQLPDAAKSIADTIFADTVNGEKTVQQIDGGTLITAQDGQGNSQAVLVTQDTAVVAEVNFGVLTLNVAIPKGIAAITEANTIQGSPDFLNQKLDDFVPPSDDPAVQAFRIQLQNAIQTITQKLGPDAKFSVITLTPITQTSAQGSGDQAPTNTVEFSGQAGSTEVLAFVMNQLQDNSLLKLTDVERALIVGKGQVETTTAALVAGDAADQKLTGSDGADTLVGGGGHDTLVGGAGADDFGVNLFDGSLTIEDFNLGQGDQVVFDNFGGLLLNPQDLAPFLNNITENQDGGTTVDFTVGNREISITLVGVSAADLTWDMVKIDNV